MGKLSVKYDKKKNLFEVSNRIKYPEVINEKILKLINGGVYHKFLHINLEKYKENKKAVLVCEVSQMVQLSSYLHKQLGRDQFLDIIIQLIEHVKICDKNLLNVNNLELDDSYIFIEPNSQKVYCIFWPLVNNQSYIPVGTFFKNFLGKVKFFSNEKTTFLNDYKKFFDSLDPFSLSSFEKLIYGFRGKQTKKITISPDSTALDQDDAVLINNKKINDATYNPFNNVRKLVDATTNVFHDSLSNNNKNLTNEYVLCMIRKSNGKKEEIVGPNVNCGKDPQKCDFVISGNNAISRFHATIKRINNEYYLIDNNSTNHTYINGCILDSNIKYAIHDRDIVKFANEEFVCVIEKRKRKL